MSVPLCFTGITLWDELCFVGPDQHNRTHEKKVMSSLTQTRHDWSVFNAKIKGFYEPPVLASTVAEILSQILEKNRFQNFMVPFAPRKIQDHIILYKFCYNYDVTKCD